jgi:hypothetical protein
MLTDEEMTALADAFACGLAQDQEGHRARTRPDRQR